MADREKLIELLGEINCNASDCDECEFRNFEDDCVRRQKEIIADHLIANGVTVQKWIPVTERLPEQYEAVIGWTGNTMGEVQLSHGDEFIWVDDDGWNNTAPVTHWMPFPEPPKGE